MTEQENRRQFSFFTGRRPGILRLRPGFRGSHRCGLTFSVFFHKIIPAKHLLFLRPIFRSGRIMTVFPMAGRSVPEERRR